LDISCFENYNFGFRVYLEFRISNLGFYTFLSEYYFAIDVKY